MKIERTQNATKNIAAGLFLKIYQMVMPFLTRTAMIYFMGVQYLGLNSLFASVLQVLNLAELGVGSAMVFSMYKPIAEDDHQTICALMKLYRKYYRLIGLVVAALGLLLTPAIPRLISGEVPADLNIYILYLINLGATVLSYWLFAYKNCLLQAHQRTDVVSMVTVIANTVQYAAQLMVLIWIRNYYLYVMVTLACVALTNVITAAAASKMYPQYKPVGELGREKEKQINQKIRDLFTGKLGYVIYKAADSIVISAFLGLTILAVYQNYFFIMTSITGFVEIIFASVMAGLGNSFVTETREKNYRDLEKFTFVFLWFAGMCTCCFAGMYQPFMEIWMGRELMLDYGAVICFAAYFYSYSLNRLLNVYKDAAGLWHQDRFRPLATALVNLGLNLLWVKRWGIYGVLLSTVVSQLFVGIPWVLHNLFTLLFDKERLASYVKQLAVYIVLTVAAGTAVALICLSIQTGSWLTLGLCAAISVAVPNTLYLLVLRKHPQFAVSVRFVDHLTKKKLKLEQRFLRD